MISHAINRVDQSGVPLPGAGPDQLHVLTEHSGLSVILGGMALDSDLMLQRPHVYIERRADRWVLYVNMGQGADNELRIAIEQETPTTQESGHRGQFIINPDGPDQRQLSLGVGMLPDEPQEDDHHE